MSKSYRTGARRYQGFTSIIQAAATTHQLFKSSWRPFGTEIKRCAAAFARGSIIPDSPQSTLFDADDTHTSPTAFRKSKRLPECLKWGASAMVRSYSWTRHDHVAADRPFQRIPRLPGAHSCGLTSGGAAARQTSVCSASSSASSTSTPRYRTVFSILVWPRRICTARRLPVAL